MGRKRTGSKFFDEKSQRWFIVLTVDLRGGGTERRPIQLPEGTTETEAEAKRVSLAAKAQNRLFEPREPIEVAGSELTLESYVTGQWLPSRIKRGLRSVRKDRERLTAHVFPVLGKMRMAELNGNKVAIRKLVESLDTKIHDPNIKFGWKTASKVWGAVTKLFRDAVKSKEAALRVIESNPCTDVEGPDRGDEKAKQWLYPREFSALVGCADVPLRWRRIYAIATYLYLRLSEVRSLHVEDVDFESGMVIVHRSTDERGDEIREFTKTSSVRQFRIEPELLPVLKAVIGDRTTGPLFGSVADPAGELRAHLLRAGVKRQALHRGTATSLALRFHDLRATGITWAALRGDPSLEIRDRAGHTDLEQTNDYMRRASLAGDVGAPFPCLSALYLTTGSVSDNVSGLGADSENSTNHATESVRRGGLEVPSTSRNSKNTQGFEGWSGSGEPPESRADDIADDSEAYSEDDFLAALEESGERADAYAAMADQSSGGDK